MKTKNIHYVWPAAGALGLAFAVATQAQDVPKLRQRSDIETSYKWRLEDIYASDKAWEADVARLEALLPRMTECRGTLDDSAGKLLEALRARDEVGELTDKLLVYAFMRRDEDTRSSVYQAMGERMQRLTTQVGEAVAFMNPEILEIADETLDRFLGGEPALALYRHALDDIRRRREHTLDTEKEELLAMAGELVRAPSNVYTLFNNADIKYGTMKDDTGADVELTKGLFARFLESPDRRVRREAFEKMNGAYAALNNTLGALMGANIKKDIFLYRARRYGSSLEASLDRDRIPVSVYTNLVEAVNSNLDPLHRYAALRKRILGVDTLRVYDLFAPLVPEEKVDLPYDQAVKTVTEGLAPLGEEYLRPFRDGLTAGWIDVFETEGKRAGAYSWGSYSTHPYVLLNHNNTLTDQFTIAHEMGHAMHTYFTREGQPYVYSDYSTFVAEVASTTNEALLIKHLLKEEMPKSRRMYLINYYLEQIRGTFYTQVLFAEFELRAHEAAEKGEPVTGDALNTLYRDIYQKYYGPVLVIDKVGEVAWSRVPHFYNSYYVFQYATSYAAATSMARRIADGGAPAAKGYIEFLKSGGSEYPVELLQRSGVDLASPKPVEDTIALFASLVDEMEKLAAER
jgi:oligoendopeptidase F